MVAKTFGILAILFGAFVLYITINADPKPFAVWARMIVLGFGPILLGIITFFFADDDDVV